MITILTTVEVVPGREAQVEELWRQARPKRDQYLGLRTDRLLRDTNRQGRYIYYSEWEAREQYDAFVRATGVLWLLDATESWRITQLSWSYCEDVEEALPTA